MQVGLAPISSSPFSHKVPRYEHRTKQVNYYRTCSKITQDSITYDAPVETNYAREQSLKNTMQKKSLKKPHWKGTEEIIN